MSLRLTDSSLNPVNPVDDSMEDQRDLARLDQYLTIIENNKKSCHFAPDDALVALDMARFTRNQLAGKRPGQPLSVARLAMALAQPCSKSPVQ